MFNLEKLKPLFFLLSITLVNQTWAQYKYTRFSVDVSAGPSLPKTSIPGSLSKFTEIGVKGTLSRFLSIRASGGIGNAQGSRDISVMTGTPEQVNNYTKFTTDYSYITGSAHISLNPIFKLRKNGNRFLRLNPFLVIGSGLIFPTIKTNRIDGQTKTYKNNVSFVTHNFGLDFKYFLNACFDLSFGAEYRIIQSYYFDGAYSDKKLDGLINAYIGISYNIGASANKKHMDWYNRDQPIDVRFAPEEEEKTIPEPISETDFPKENDTSKIVQSKIDTFQLANANELKQEVTDTLSSERPDKNVSKKTGRYVDIKPGDPASHKIPVKEIITLRDRDEATPTIIDSVNRSVTVPEEYLALPLSLQPEITYIEQKPEANMVPVDTSPSPSVTSAPQPSKILDNEAKNSAGLNSINGIVRPLGKYNVIVATYSGSRYAYPFRNKLRKQGIEAALFKSSDRSKMVRVAVYYGDDKREALKKLKYYQNKFGKEVWIHVYHK